MGGRLDKFKIRSNNLGKLQKVQKIDLTSENNSTSNVHSGNPDEDEADVVDESDHLSDHTRK